MNFIEDLMTSGEINLYKTIVKPFNIGVLRKALDKKLLEDPEYEVFVPFEYWKGKKRLKEGVDPLVQLDWLFVSNRGRVYSTRGKEPRFLTPSVGGVGYYYIQVSINNRNNTFAMHRVLGCLFVPPTKDSGSFNPSKMEINHKDGVKLNIDLGNLEWSTGSENIVHALENGLNTCRKPIVGEVIFGGFKGYRFGLPSARQAVPFGFCFKGINTVCKGRRKHHKGVQWSYAGQEDITLLPNDIPQEVLTSLDQFVRKTA